MVIWGGGGERSVEALSYRCRESDPAMGREKARCSLKLGGREGDTHALSKRAKDFPLLPGCTSSGKPVAPRQRKGVGIERLDSLGWKQKDHLPSLQGKSLQGPPGFIASGHSQTTFASHRLPPPSGLLDFLPSRPQPRRHHPHPPHQAATPPRPCLPALFQTLKKVLEGQTDPLAGQAD